jgi:phosphoglycolate phosphatase
MQMHTCRALVDDFDAFVFDCDGVLWSGNRVIDGAGRTLASLAERGKKVFFVTNNSSKTFADIEKKFKQLGLSSMLAQESVYSSSLAIPHWIARERREGKAIRKAFIIGSPAMVSIVRGAGVEVVKSELEDGDLGKPPEEMAEVEHDREVDTVFVGFDKDLSYYKLAYATLCILENPGCRYIATNQDL